MKQGSVKPSSLIALATVLLVGAFLLSACKPDVETAPPTDIGDSIVVSSFSREYQDFELAMDLDFSKDLIERLSVLGDDPVTGFRTAGSPAETEAAAILEAAMRRAGLQNVTRDRPSVDSWVFGGASLIFEKRNGGQQKIDLGGYPVNLVADDQAIMLVDAGKGGAADYEGLDVNGKLVLLYSDGEDVDAAAAGFRAVQAKQAGAKAIIFCPGADAETGGRLLSAGFGAPSDAPAFAISAEDRDLLKTALKRTENGELPVIFNSDSVVAGGAPTDNIWGEIPGKSDEVIYMLSNYDGFYHSVFEGAAGVSAMLGVAKALCDSGFMPNKTIRFIACGAGEWGAVNTPFDRGAGAWRQISRVHPEWAEQAFAVMNTDAVYPTKNKLSFGMAATDEIYAFAARSADQIIETGMYNFTWYSSENPGGITAEDNAWNMFGIPSVAAEPGDGDKFRANYRRSSLDTIEALGFDDGAYRFSQLLFGKLILDMDEMPVRPLDFERGLRAVLASLEALPTATVRLSGALSAAIADAARLTVDIDTVNMRYLESGEEERAFLSAAAVNLNRELYALNRLMRDAFSRADRGGVIVTPHEEAGVNISMLNDAVSVMSDHDAAGSANILKNVAFGRYADYDVRVCDYFASQDGAGTWAEGRETGPVCRADAVIRSLRQRVADGDVDLSAEIDETNGLLAKEHLLLREALDGELLRIEEIASRLGKLVNDIAPLLAEEQ
jgi:hypothetical protein